MDELFSLFDHISYTVMVTNEEVLLQETTQYYQP